MQSGNENATKLYIVSNWEKIFEFVTVLRVVLHKLAKAKLLTFILESISPSHLQSSSDFINKLKKIVIENKFRY